MGLKVGHSDAVHWNAFGFYAYVDSNIPKLADIQLQIYLNRKYAWEKMANSNGDDWSKGGWTGQGS